MPTSTPAAKPAFFRADGPAFIPQPLAANPWFDNAVAGGPISALFGHLIEQHELAPAGFTVARMTIDILGIVPSAALHPVITTIRQGRQMQLHHIALMHEGRTTAQAQVLIARELETPAFPAPFDYPSPDDVRQAPFLANGTLTGIIRTRPIQGSVTEPGRGIVWLGLDADIVAGVAASPFAQSCVFADFGNGVGSSTSAADWSFANLDVGIQFLRYPVGNWFLIDADTVGAGNGHALTRSVMADQQGVFALGSQTIFVAPGANTPKMRGEGVHVVG